MKSISLTHLATATLLFQCASSRALDFQYSFLNNDGYLTDPTAVVTGRILGLTDNMPNNGQFSVTLDSISGGDNLGFAPHSWFDFGTFMVVNGAITYAQFSSFDSSLAIEIYTGPGGRGLVNPLPDYVPFYRNQTPDEGYPEITFTALPEGNVPDGGNTLSLLGFGLASVAGVRRFARAL